MREEIKTECEMEIKCLRRICCITIGDRIRNEEIRRRVGELSDLSGRVEKCMLRWFGHVERVDGESMVKRVYDSGVEGRWGRGIPYRGWMDRVKLPLSERG